MARDGDKEKRTTRVKALSPRAMSELPSDPGSTVRFLSPQKGGLRSSSPAATMETHELDVESPGATLQRKVCGRAIPV